MSNEPTSAETPTPDVSIIVPALNEAENLPPLAGRIAAAMGQRSYEIIIVDDNSPDGTPDICRELARRHPLRLLVRLTPRHGLSGAVLEGIAIARGKTLVVMDADLQHPPEKVPALLDALDQGAEFALGSRYVPGGSTAAQWTLFRKLNSWAATALARPFAGPVHDPMSGFFALRTATFARAQRLTPLGYKIALELMCKCRVVSVQEVPIHFSLREHGHSKLSLKQQFRYLEHLSRLYDFTYPRASPILKFLIATALAFFVGSGAFFAIIATGQPRTVSILLGYVFSIAVTAIFHARYVRTQREFLLTHHPWLEFVAVTLGEVLAVGLAAWWLAARAPATGNFEAFTLAFLFATVVRYILRKELMLDIRGLRRDVRMMEIE